MRIVAETENISVLYECKIIVVLVWHDENDLKYDFLITVASLIGLIDYNRI